MLEFHTPTLRPVVSTISDMRNGLRLTKFAAVFVAVMSASISRSRIYPRRLSAAMRLRLEIIETLSLTADGESPSLAKGPPKASDSVLPRKVVVSIGTVTHFFPEITREASTGQNMTAVANAKATRSVIYANSDSSKKITITVDQYSTANDAASAYQEAVAKSKTVRGFKSVPAENLGQNTFVGTVTQGGETHIGLGARHGMLIVGATLAGYDPTPENTAKLISLTRAQERAAKAAMDPNRQK
jgi:hypothetical protein